MQQPSVDLAPAAAVRLATAMVAHVAREVGARCLIIKGVAADDAGLRPPRVSADVDALLDPVTADAVIARLRELGWHDRPGYQSLLLSGGHSVTLVHDSWPIDLDLHRRWPGFTAEPDAVFDLLWADRADAEIAGRRVEMPATAAHLLILALHALRDDPSADLSSAAAAIDPSMVASIAEIARRAEATRTAAPLLEAIGVPVTSSAAPNAAEIAWAARFKPDAGVAGWLIELRQAPGRSRLALLRRAVLPSRNELVVSHHRVGPGRTGLVGAWVRRWGRAVVRLPRAISRSRTLG